MEIETRAVDIGMPGPAELIIWLVFLFGVVGAIVLSVVLSRNKNTGQYDHDNPNLIPCPDCGHFISRKARSCPQCGCPVNLPPTS